jgi:6-phosphogluconate dehydrogenase
MLETISAHVDGTPCCTHIGPDGAGHFVKMVHNGIEYADMQLIAEAYDLLRHGAALEPAQIAETFRTWNTGRLDSYLIEITAEVLAHTDASTNKPFVDIVLDQAEQKGTGRWTVQDALDLGVPVSGIAEAVFSRSLSGHADLRRAARGLPGRDGRVDDASFADQVEQALYASKLVSYAQGWHMMAVGSREYDWNLDLGRIATIWRGGCIIRAVFLDRIRSAYENNAELPTLLTDEDFSKDLADAQEAWRNVIATATQIGIPVPGFSAALSYYDALRAERLPAALIQGLRDFFGAHTYRRTDREGSFHTLWAAEGRAEETR